MSISHILSDFTALQATADFQQPDAMETFRLEVFETGYKAGWDDAAKAYDETNTRLSNDVLRNLCDLSLEHQSNYAQLQTRLTTIVNEISNGLIPTVADQSFAPKLIIFVEQQLKDTGLDTLDLHLSSKTARRLGDLMTPDLADRINLKVSPDLSETQAILQINGDAIEFTFKDAIEKLSDELAGFLSQQTKKGQ